jgi:hypothetical protein
VAADFGTSSEAYQHASVFFSQKPNPINGGGVLVVGYWRAASETVAASAGILTGGQITEASVIPQLQLISDGSFNIDIDETVENVTGLDFRTVSSIDDVLAVLNADLAGLAVATFENQKIIITSDTTGAASVAGYATVGATGTFIGELLNLSNGSGALSVDGEASSVLAAETKVEAVTIVKSLVNFKGFCFAGATTDQESKDLATWTMANAVMSYDVFTSASNLEKDITNPAWEIKLASQNQYRMLYRKDGNRKFAAGYMARMHVVNFNATNTALTMNLKEIIGVPSEEFSQSEIAKAKAVGVDIYVAFKDVPKLLTSGANDFTDNPYNLLAYIDAVQTDAFNLLGTASTKIPQTQRGINLIVDTVEKTTEGFVNAGVFAAGPWTSSETFGNLNAFTKSIESKGYYVLAESLAAQSTADRQARISPPINVAVKNAGAVHQIDIIIRFNI